MIVQIFTTALALIILLTVVLLVRSYVLPEKYALIWIIAGFVTLVFAVFPDVLPWFATLLGVADPLNLLFVVSLIFILLMLMQLSLDLAKTRKQLRETVQALSLERLQSDEES